MGAAVGAAAIIPAPFMNDSFVPMNVVNGGTIRIYAGAVPTRPSMIDPGMMLAEIILEPFEMWKEPPS